MASTATMMTAACPGCRSPVRYTEAFAGREVRCQVCSGVFNLPSPGGGTPAMSSAATSPAPIIPAKPPPPLPQQHQQHQQNRQPRPLGPLGPAKSSGLRITAVVLLALAVVVVLARIIIHFTGPPTMAERVAALGRPGADRTAALDGLDKALSETMDPAEQRTGLAGLIALLKDPDVAVRRDAAGRLLGLANGTSGGGMRRNDQRRVMKETVQRLRSDVGLASALASARDDEDVLVRRRIAMFLGLPTPRDVSFYVCPDVRAADGSGSTAPASGAADQEFIEQALRKAGYPVVDREADADVVAEFTPDPKRTSADPRGVCLWDRARGTLLAPEAIVAAANDGGGLDGGARDWWIERHGGRVQVDVPAATSLGITPPPSGEGARVYIEPRDWANFAGLQVLEALRSGGVEVVRHAAGARAAVRMTLTFEQYGTYEHGDGAYRYTFDVSVTIGSAALFHETLTAADPATLVYRNDGGPMPKRGSDLLKDQLRPREAAIVEAARAAGRR